METSHGLPILNLDDEQECRAFVKEHGTLKGRALANRLRLRGSGSAKLATALSCFAWNAYTAHECRRRGDVSTALIYEKIADRIYDQDIRRFGIW